MTLPVSLDYGMVPKGSDLSRILPTLRAQGEGSMRAIRQELDRFIGHQVIWYWGDMDVTGKYPVIDGTQIKNWVLCDGTVYRGFTTPTLSTIEGLIPLMRIF
jgi:hypothetical protein